MSLLTKKGYSDRYYFYCKEGFTDQKSYEKTQDDYELIYPKVEVTGFSCSESFKNALRKWLKAGEI